MDDRILQYLDGQLSESEKRDFEKELNSSPKLKKKYDEYISSQSELNDLRNIEIDKTYFNGIVPEFRRRVEVKKKTKRIFSFSFANSLAAILILYFVLKPSGNDLNLNEIAKNWTANDFDNAIEYVEQPYTVSDITDSYNTAELDSVISGILTNELNLSSNNNSYLIDNSLDYNKISAQINNTETNNLYNKILNKKYF